MGQLAHSITRRISALLVIGFSEMAQAQTLNVCGDLANAFGPFDYRTVRGEQLRLVESAHFTPTVESLIRGATSTRAGQDIDYTLRAFPNHHRALIAASRLAIRDKSPQPSGMRYPVDCYFERAIRFQSNDLVARMLFVEHLNKTGRQAEAKPQLAYVFANAGDNALTYYHVGLLYLEMKEYDHALAAEHRAQTLGLIRPELKERLKAAGKWSEPVATQTDAASGSAPSDGGAAGLPGPASPGAASAPAPARRM